KLVTGVQTCALPIYDIFLKHYRRYNLDGIYKTIRSAGLMPLSSGYFFISLLPLRLFKKMGEKLGYKRQEKGIGDWSGSTFISGLFKNYLLFDYKFSKLLGKVGIRLPGLSAYCICKKLAS